MRMVSHPIGFPKERELVVIETPDLTCVIKGTAAHPQYNKLKRHMQFKMEDAMTFHCQATNLEEVRVYDVLSEKLADYDDQSLLPIFFENGRYEIIVIPKEGKNITFYHEFKGFREAVQKVSRSNFLTGILHFQNEVGLTSFEILEEQQVLLSVTLEVFPTKLDYKKDYKALLDGVNDEIYNLAYHFIKRTYLKGSAKIYKEPSLSEFYRLIERHFEQYKRAIERIERTSHHQLIKTYTEVRGERLKRQDARTLSYLRKNANNFVEVSNGIPIYGRNLMPTKGLVIQKEHTSDTYENRYVKWTMMRIVTRLNELKRVMSRSFLRGGQPVDEALVHRITGMAEWLEKRKKHSFWREISRLDRSVMSLFLQMAPGYRNVLQIYITISKSIVLHGEIYKMAVKDIATLYEYWTFLKLGRILQDKCKPISQDIIQVKSDGIFVRLDKSRTAERRYEHPVTREEVILKYQFDTTKNRVPTVQQKPDSMLSIGKKGKDYNYQYIFDAKYRLDLETNADYPGPMQEDINTMHRYRDSIVVNTDGRYERTAFGAYVLFPWHNQEDYKQHLLYQSIDRVNIGGFPFLPNATRLVEQFIDNLLNKSPEELQQEGILPKGAYNEIELRYSIEQVLVIGIDGDGILEGVLRKAYYEIPVDRFHGNWQLIRYIAMYEEKAGDIREYVEVRSCKIIDKMLTFKIGKRYPKLIEGKGYRILQPMIINKNHFMEAQFLTDMYLKSPEEEILQKILQRMSNHVFVHLDEQLLEKANYVQAFEFEGYELQLNYDERRLIFIGLEVKEVIHMDLILDNSAYIFQRLTELIYP